MVAATTPIQLPELTNADLARYARHISLPEVGVEGQQKLKSARVLCVGAGGLGSPLALYLAAAGIGTLGIVDFDVVDASNLQRQIIHATNDIGRSKLDSAAEKLAALNPGVKVVKHETMLSPAPTPSTSSRTTTSSPTAPITSPRATWSTTPAFSWASPTSTVRSFASKARPASLPRAKGLATVASIPEPPPPGTVPNCAEGGVLGILPGLVGIIQATEVIKLVLAKATRSSGASSSSTRSPCDSASLN